MLKSPKSKRSSVAAQSILRRVESERDEAVADLRRMTTERDSLRERLKVSLIIFQLFKRTLMDWELQERDCCRYE